MLCFVTNKGVHGWHNGCQIPNLKNETLLEIQADCDELEYIQRNFRNIPFHNGRVQIWTGEIAKFILHGIRAMNTSLLHPTDR